MTITPRQLDAAKAAGAAAFLTGRDMELNNPLPHPDATGGALLWNAWRQGFSEAEETMHGPVNFDGESNERKGNPAAGRGQRGESSD